MTLMYYVCNMYCYVTWSHTNNMLVNWYTYYAYAYYDIHITHIHVSKRVQLAQRGTTRKSHHGSSGGEAWKEEALDDLSWKDERIKAVVNQTNTGNISKVTKLGESSERRGWGRSHMGFSERIDTILNWTELTLQNLFVTIIIRHMPFVKSGSGRLTAPARKMSWSKMHGRACKQYIFRSYNTYTFNAMRFDENPLTGQCEKEDNNT